MQKTEHRFRLLHLSTTGSAFCIVVSLLVVTAASVCAGEPAMTLAMADHHQPPAESAAAAPTNLMSSAAVPLFESKGISPVSIHPQEAAAAEFVTDTRLKTMPESNRPDSLRLSRENTSRSNAAFTVQAGYGRIWDEQSMLQKISEGHQEVGCAYVRANISF